MFLQRKRVSFTVLIKTRTFTNAGQYSVFRAVVLQQMGILGAFVILLVIVWRFRRRRHHIKLQTNTEA